MEDCRILIDKLIENINKDLSKDKQYEYLKKQIVKTMNINSDKYVECIQYIANKLGI